MYDPMHIRERLVNGGNVGSAFDGVYCWNFAALSEILPDFI